MSTKRAGSSGQRRATKAATSTSTAKKPRALDATEEKVLRMRKGQTVPDDMPLERVGQQHPATRLKLMEIEARAFERSGRLDELRREAGLPATKTDVAKKEKIIGKLTNKVAPAAKPVVKKVEKAAKKVEAVAKKAATAVKKAVGAKSASKPKAKSR